VDTRARPEPSGQDGVGSHAPHANATGTRIGRGICRPRATRRVVRSTRSPSGATTTTTRTMTSSGCCVAATAARQRPGPIWCPATHRHPPTAPPRCPYAGAASGYLSAPVSWHDRVLRHSPNARIAYASSCQPACGPCPPALTRVPRPGSGPAPWCGQVGQAGRRAQPAAMQPQQQRDTSTDAGAELHALMSDLIPVGSRSLFGKISLRAA
jgi:hypothetical protein